MSEKITDGTSDSGVPRLVDRPRPGPGSEAPEDRAAALLRQLREPPPLGAAALGRIAARLDEAAEAAAPPMVQRRQSWRPLWLVPALGAAVALAALVQRGPASVPAPGPGQVAGTAAAPRPLALAAGASERLRAGGAEFLLQGPASALVAGDAPSPAAGEDAVSLRAGRLVVRAGAAAISVAVPGGRVAIAPSALVEIRVSARGGLRVAAYAGSAAIDMDGQGVLREVSTGQIFDGGALSPAAKEARAAAERALDGVESPESEAAPDSPPASAGETPRDAATPARSPLAGRPAPVVPPALAAPAPAVSPGRQALVTAETPAPPAGPAEGRAPAGPSASKAAFLAPAGRGVSPGGEGEAGLAAESRLLGDALGRLRARDGEGALALLDEHRARFPRGALSKEAQGERIEALLLLGRRPAALAELDALPLSGAGRGAELRVLRADLRADAGRCEAALADFSAALALADSAAGLTPALEERARYGRATCRARAGDQAGARADLDAYLQRFPGGRFSDAAREALGR